ncbi:hypothetical protein QV08_10150 [Gallibacterium salpingitidis]|uniref:Uncharacterized protein n=1 Tax=Gallibacterium salpingitidis TaxID=505341 RepID=A0A1A7P342_9PAST|nr:hypothetical protein [Gallibacterium salpingitidis]OBW96423.1 hypothetical protein QS62_00310 [Gallibacterium salpingitidis]OBX06484.1 hypothetical protein QV08_10150 [Gallibacterium salpingitidis]
MEDILVSLSARATVTVLFAPVMLMLLLPLKTTLLAVSVLQEASTNVAAVPSVSQYTTLGLEVPSIFNPPVAAHTFIEPIAALPPNIAIAIAVVKRFRENLLFEVAWRLSVVLYLL